MPASELTCLSNPSDPVKRILCIGYPPSDTRIIDALCSHNCYVDYTDGPIGDHRGDYDFIVSFGYRHILKQDVIDRFGCPIFNLHIAYLPFNRGAHPNFWSFYDGTPSGVTIHLIDKGVDTGDIVAQKRVAFDRGEVTFVQTYARLIDEIEALFVGLIPALLADDWQAVPQQGEGTHHFVKDLPQNFAGWDSVIDEEVARLKEMAGTSRCR